jgi:hypothetical protein
LALRCSFQAHVLRARALVAADGRRRLLTVFDRVVDIPYLTATCIPLRTAKQQAMYSTWKEISFTKWNAL